MENAKNLIKEISDRVKETNQHGASSKDEVKVMKAMLNDTSYEVDIYDKTGVKATYNPAKEVRSTISGIISNTTKIPKAEAEGYMEGYEFKSSEAQTFVNVSKEFVNTYLDTDRKLPFGTREKSDISIIANPKEASTRTYPAKVEENGETKYIKETIAIPAHTSAKIVAKCPDHLKK
jgi:hypothetical protein